MPEEDKKQPAGTASEVAPPEGFYKTPTDAYQRVGNEFDYWTGKLTDTSLQMCYALIGANWVVFGSVGNILKSNWSKFSLLAVMLTLAINLSGSWRSSSLHLEIINRADKDRAQWAKDFEAAKDSDPHWPFTQSMEKLGVWMRRAKGALPLIGAILWLIGAIVSSGSQGTKPSP
jgi:hypothetical protein